MAETHIHVVTGGAHADHQLEMVMATRAMADAMAQRLSGDVRTLPVLDYMPEKVTIWVCTVLHYPSRGWTLGHLREGEVWDFEAPKVVPVITYEELSRIGACGPVKTVKIVHRDRATVRTVAEAIHVSLTSGADHASQD